MSEQQTLRGKFKEIDLQGKTILEYTIRDNVKIDSIVVFKDSIYGKEN